MTARPETLLSTVLVVRWARTTNICGVIGRSQGKIRKCWLLSGGSRLESVFFSNSVIQFLLSQTAKIFPDQPFMKIISFPASPGHPPDLNDRRRPSAVQRLQLQPEEKAGEERHHVPAHHQLRRILLGHLRDKERGIPGRVEIMSLMAELNTAIACSSLSTHYNF